MPTRAKRRRVLTAVALAATLAAAIWWVTAPPAMPRALPPPRVLLPVLVDGQWGLIDDQGRYVLEPQSERLLLWSQARTEWNRRLLTRNVWESPVDLKTDDYSGNEIMARAHAYWIVSRRRSWGFQREFPFVARVEVDYGALYDSAGRFILATDTPPFEGGPFAAGNQWYVVGPDAVLRLPTEPLADLSILSAMPDGRYLSSFTNANGETRYALHAPDGRRLHVQPKPMRMVTPDLIIDAAPADPLYTRPGDGDTVHGLIDLDGQVVLPRQFRIMEQIYPNWLVLGQGGDPIQVMNLRTRSRLAVTDVRPYSLLVVRDWNENLRLFWPNPDDVAPDRPAGLIMVSASENHVAVSDGRKIRFLSADLTETGVITTAGDAACSPGSAVFVVSPEAYQDGGPFTIYTSDGRLIGSFDSVKTTGGPTLIVRGPRGWGVIDATGHYILPPQYARIWLADTGEGRDWQVQIDTGAVGIHDGSDWLVPPIGFVVALRRASELGTTEDRIVRQGDDGRWELIRATDHEQSNPPILATVPSGGSWVPRLSRRWLISTSPPAGLAVAVNLADGTTIDGIARVDLLEDEYLRVETLDGRIGYVRPDGTWLWQPRR